MSHPSRITLERHSVEELPALDRAELERHLEACADCRAYAAELRGAAAAHRAAPPEPFVARVRARRRAEARRARWLGAGIAGAVAAAAVALLAIRPERARPPEELAIKGGGVAIHRLRGGAVAPLGERDRVRAGDALRFVVTLDRPGRATAWIVDDAGRIDAIASRVALPAGGAPLPDAVELEAPCRDSVLVVAIGDAADRWTTADVRAEPSLRPGGPGSPPAGILAVEISCER